MPGQPGSSFIPLFLKEGRHTGHTWAPEQETGAKRPNQCGRSFVQTLPSMIKAQNQKQKQEKAQPSRQTRQWGQQCWWGPWPTHSKGLPPSSVSHRTNDEHPRAAKLPTKPGVNLRPVCGRSQMPKHKVVSPGRPRGCWEEMVSFRTPVYVHRTTGHTSTACSKLPSQSRAET